MTLQHKGRTIHLPPTWHSMGFTARAGYLSAQGMSYSEACKIVRGPRHARKRPRITAQEAFAAMEKRGLA